VMIIQGDKGMQHLLASKFQLERTPRRRPDRWASCLGDTDWKLDTEVLTYSRAKGALPD